MASIAAMARKHQPGLLVVDRTVGGEYENYVTPEGHVPDADLGVPWETCMPMGTSWSWVPNEKYKSTDEIILTLVSVVSRGGSLLLNVAPGPDGQLDSTAYVRLNEVGEWLKVNGEAVYGTRPVPRDHEVSTECSMSADGNVLYLMDSYGDDWSFAWYEAKAPAVSILGADNRLKVKFDRRLKYCFIDIPVDVKRDLQAGGRTVVLKVTKQ
jgi:alpha-L-fucosidase